MIKNVPSSDDPISTEIKLLQDIFSNYLVIRRNIIWKFIFCITEMIFNLTLVSIAVWLGYNSNLFMAIITGCMTIFVSGHITTLLKNISAKQTQLLKLQEEAEIIITKNWPQLK